MKLNTDILSKASNQARGLAIDAIHKCNSGHLGLPLGTAEIGAVLFGNSLAHNPAQPRWLNRDRFVLSAGHGSMFLYSWLHLSGYDLSMDDLKSFRQLHSKTPGHPEFRETPGVECTTGPLGQGIANATGFALSQKMAAARFNTATHTLFDAHTITLAGDGCMQEGVALEAISFAAHNKLDNLIVIYDSNDVTLDAMADKTQSDDVAKRFKALNWDVQIIDGHDLAAIAKSLKKAKGAKSQKPQLIIAKTTIAKGIPEVAGTPKGHGEGGAKFAEAARAGLGLPPETFFVSDDVREYFAAHKKRLARQYNKWLKTYKAWAAENPANAALLEGRDLPISPEQYLEKIPAFPADAKLATRAAGQQVLQPLAAANSLLIGGSADLYGSTLNYIASDKDYNTLENPAGRNIRFGIREHAMASIANGLAYDGVFQPSVATFLVFADYSRPAMRIASLAGLPVAYIYTHDSIGVGEDGPTHQPVETISSLRLIPNMHVIRPADPEETAAAYAAAFSRKDGPTLLALSRQALPNNTNIPVEVRRNGTLRGAYIAVQEAAPLERILIATGSELQHAIAAAQTLGASTRVVSMPCMELFDKQPADYREQVLPAACQKRFSIEAGVTALWHKYVGPEGKVIGIDRFGMSAPAPLIMKELGITPENLIAQAQ